MPRSAIHSQSKLELVTRLGFNELWKFTNEILNRGKSSVFNFNEPG